ncbi:MULTISPECIES: potassium/proton antiporter [Clostridium]|uniref:Potassium/proton antiporter n=1 Tax=Clostridium disporicum TaxID=84024 RepID=A0A174BSN8_9CLOT|nr:MULTISPECIES: potassium/proton antiporter [Clostridium]CUO03627.1 potassium/proton antiporter [Clostridium disporicum]
MISLMIICSLVLLICITSTKILYKFGVPILLIFIVLGMLFGSDGIVGIYFDNYELASDICSIALIFIMFYGGFGTNWKMAKPIAVQSILMSSLGVVITAGLTGLFSSIVFKTSLLEGLLIGAVIASTDAAAVFAILRSQKLNLKGSIASILEIESGSNDPFAYMLTIIILGLMSNQGYGSIVPMLLNQIIVGILASIVLAKLSVYLLRNVMFEIEGFYPIFITAIAILSYSLSEYFGGNGYLSVYITGIIIGNSKIPHKKSIFQFFDGVSWLMQNVLVPNGSTVILPGDTLVLSGNTLANFEYYKEGKSTNLVEISVNSDSSIANKSIKDSNINKDILIVMIKRNDKVIVPNGNTVIKPKDILVVTANDFEEVESLVIA